MGKTKPHSRKPRKNSKSVRNNAGKPDMTAAQLLMQATDLIQTSQLEDALIAARRALELLHLYEKADSPPPHGVLPALSLLGDISVELGDIERAREYFLAAAALDEDGSVPEAAGGGADKFLWLAQLCEQGGVESVAWFAKGAAVLRKEIAALEAFEKKGAACRNVALDEKERKLANALCGMVEVFMTDLSWEEDAEQRCEALITEALLVHANNPESLQTLASVRISQLRHDEARMALKTSMDLWKDLEPGDANVPGFPVRISLCRLLMEAELEDEALKVLERLIQEDDQSVEAWYLGGWCLHLMADKHNASGNDETAKGMLRSSRQWLATGLELCHLMEYEDDRLKGHAAELVEEINAIVGLPMKGGNDATDSESGEDDDMQGA